ncbi:MAG TPA: hypothetical protein VKB04_03620 [Anaerolineales bacterium]|nr:hypothetical protein [Anaerolineales bacterium]
MEFDLWETGFHSLRFEVLEKVLGIYGSPNVSDEYILRHTLRDRVRFWKFPD